MKYQVLPLLTLAARAFAGACDTPVKNFIYIVPDGYGPASQTMARDYISLLGTDPDHPVTEPLAADELVCTYYTYPFLWEDGGADR